MHTWGLFCLDKYLSCLFNGAPKAPLNKHAAVCPAVSITEMRSAHNGVCEHTASQTAPNTMWPQFVSVGCQLSLTLRCNITAHRMKQKAFLSAPKNLSDICRYWVIIIDIKNEIQIRITLVQTLAYYHISGEVHCSILAIQVSVGVQYNAAPAVLYN